MKAQEIFNVVSAHLLTQGVRAVRGGDDPDQARMCMYRAPNGAKCAAGVLIPDSAYSPSMEGKNSSALIEDFRGVLPEFMDENSGLIRRLQSVHDVYEPHEWKQKLNDLAYEYGLVGVLEEAA
jgi:hypothetical protein